MAGVATYALTLSGTDISTESRRGSVSYDESLVQNYEIATGVTDEAISIGGVATIDVLFLESDQAITLNINSSTGTDITVDANKPLLITGTSITALYVSNSSGSTANIRYVLLGT